MMWSADDLAEGIADTTIPAPEAQIKGTAAAPVFTTADDFATASLKSLPKRNTKAPRPRMLMKRLNPGRVASSGLGQPDPQLRIDPKISARLTKYLGFDRQGFAPHGALELVERNA
jgi:hypothetical protein